MLLVGIAALSAAAAVQAPISQVTVYSDRARVVRVGQVTLDGREVVELPLLDDSVDPSTIQLEATGASVLEVHVAHVDEEDFPRDEARAVLAALEKLDDRIAELTSARDIRQRQLGQLQRIAPALKLDDQGKQNPKLSSGGWEAALGFVEASSEKLQARLAESREALYQLHRERETLAVKAAQLGGARRRSGHRTLATLNGNGEATLRLTYMAANARWYPSYDVQFLADQGVAQIALAGQVSQESGEDWSDALLTLSTAVPATVTAMPKLLSWKIGEAERFIPTPAPQPEPPIAAPPAAPALPQKRSAAEDEELKQRLAALGQAPQKSADAPSEVENDALASEVSAEELRRGVAGGTLGLDAKERPPSPSRRQMKKAPQMPLAMLAPPAPPPVVAAAPRPMLMRIQRGKDAAPQQAPMVPNSNQVGLAPPPAYRPPLFAADLPASLAGGFDLSFASLRKETVKTGDGPHRVPLFSERWPVSAERVVYPALAPAAAFLVAEIKNPSARVLPGGPAELSVGADPAGVAQLKLVAPGESFTLPLGLDRALKPIRNVNIVTEEKGVFSKDEVTHYKVTIELANPYQQVTPVKVVDQLPLPANKDAEVNLEEISPQPSKRNKETGQLEWHLQLAPAEKQIVTFTYSVRRPKGYRLYQEQ